MEDRTASTRLSSRGRTKVDVPEAAAANLAPQAVPTGDADIQRSGGHLSVSTPCTARSRAFLSQARALLASPGARHTEQQPPSEAGLETKTRRATV